MNKLLTGFETPKCTKNDIGLQFKLHQAAASYGYMYMILLQYKSATQEKHYAYSLAGDIKYFIKKWAIIFTGKN